MTWDILFENSILGWYWDKLGLYWDNGKENGDYYYRLILYKGYIGIMEKKMETTILY